MNIHIDNSLSSATGLPKGSHEYNALKTIHRDYNGLNGYGAMLEIVKRFKWVLYPFIGLSIIGSTYSFYNDFSVAFAMLPTIIIGLMSLFFSVILEVVRDGALIAVFNSKMKVVSRSVVGAIFLGVTVYLFSSHFNAIEVIKKQAIASTLEQRKDADLITTNPRYKIALESLTEAKNELSEIKLEKTPELIKNTSSLISNKRKDAIQRLESIDKKIAEKRKLITSLENEIVEIKKANIQDITKTQETVSGVLLATLILIESFAMLGAVIKLITKDNAQQHLIRHKEITEEFLTVQQVLANTNITVQQMMAKILEAQSLSNGQSIEMILDSMIASMKMQKDTAKTVHATQQPNTALEYDPSKNKDQMLLILYKNGTVKPNEKLEMKSKVVDKNKRQPNRRLTAFYKELVALDVIYNKGQGRNGGYYAKVDYVTAKERLTQGESNV